MGQASEVLAFLNMEKAPADFEWLFHFHHIEKTKELMDVRTEYRMRTGLDKRSAEYKNKETT